VSTIPFLLTIPDAVVERLVTIRVKQGRWESHWVEVERRDGLAGTKWAVMDTGLCLNHKGHWEREPMPSSRTDAFLRRCRFDTFAEAWEAAEKCEVYT
jgi:hypothetical protein